MKKQPMFKMQMTVEVTDREDLLGVLQWVIEHLTPEKWDEYVQASPHSSTLFRPEEVCECHGKTHKQEQIGKLFLAPTESLMFQMPRQTGNLTDAD